MLATSTRRTGGSLVEAVLLAETRHLLAVRIVESRERIRRIERDIVRLEANPGNAYPQWERGQLFAERERLADLRGLAAVASGR